MSTRSGSKKQGKLSQLARQVDSDDVEADYYRRVRDGEYNSSGTRSNDLSDGDEEEYDDDEGDVEEDEYIGEEEDELEQVVHEEDEEDEEESGDEDEDDEDEDEGEDEDTLTSEVFRVQVLSDFEGELVNDLSIKTGDILTIKELRKDGWWLAEDASGNVGVVPKTLVERIPDSVKEKQPREKKVASVPAKSPPPETSIKQTRSGTELWGKVKQGKLDKKTSATDVLKAMRAMPSGFRKPTLGTMISQEDYQVGAWIFPKLTSSNLAFKDLHWDAVENKLRQHTVRTTRHCTILTARMVPRVGSGVSVISQQIHVALWDGKNVLSNVHTIRVSPVEKDLMIWNVVKNPQMSIYEADFLVRSNSLLVNVGILFELSVSYIRTKTGERSDVSCGWCVLKLFQDTGAPAENKNYELPLNGGTPYESNVELDPSTSGRVTSGLMQSLMRVNRQPRLVVKLAPVTKAAKEMYDLLPETLVTCVQYTAFIACYREIMAEQLVQDPDNITVTDLIPDPVLSTFPKVLFQPDLMDALKIIWDERSKKSLRQSMRQRDRKAKKSLFHAVYMDAVFPLLKLVSLPPLVNASPEVEQERSTIILAFLARKNTVNTLLSDEFAYKPFNLNRICFDIISRHCVNR